MVPCPDVAVKTVIWTLYSFFRLPAYIQLDRATASISDQVRQTLHEQGIAISKTTSYNHRITVNVRDITV